VGLVLGIDSAPRRTGWALVERDGRQERLVAYGALTAVDADVVTEFSGQVVHRCPSIDVVAIEDAYYGENVGTTKALSRLVGRWQQAFEGLGLETKLVMADVWQRGILTGLITPKSGREARKAAAAIWVRSTFGTALGADEADAAGLATWELRQRRFAQRAGAV